MVGAYITAAIIILPIGITGYSNKLVRHIPRGIACGMMAGILLPFGPHAFAAASTQPLLAFGMIAAYVIFKRLLPRYSIVLVLLTGAALAMLLGMTHFSDLSFQMARPIFIRPEWTAGKIEAADGSTLFLDEICEIPLDIQPHLLRVLEENEIYRLGENTLRKVISAWSPRPTVT